MIRYAHCCSASRREFLGAVGALGAGALLAGMPAFAQAPATRRVDIHHHFGSPDWIRMTDEVTKSLKDHGMIFNTPDVEPFRKMARDNGFYTEIKKKMGDQPWALLEKYTGKLV